MTGKLAGPDFAEQNEDDPTEGVKDFILLLQLSLPFLLYQHLLNQSLEIQTWLALIENSKLANKPNGGMDGCDL